MTCAAIACDPCLRGDHADCEKAGACGCATHLSTAHIPRHPFRPHPANSSVCARCVFSGDRPWHEPLDDEWVPRSQRCQAVRYVLHRSSTPPSPRDYERPLLCGNPLPCPEHPAEATQ